jgi:hypothetical protein
MNKGGSREKKASGRLYIGIKYVHIPFNNSLSANMQDYLPGSGQSCGLHHEQLN